MKCGLVLEGGAMRGLFTAGVTDVMLEGLTYDGIVGVSAGAVFGCNYKSKQPGRVLRYNLRFSRDPRYCSLRSWLRTGDLYGADFCYRVIPDKLDLFDRETYAANPMDFYVVCTDAETGRAVYRNCLTGDEEDLLWMRASASMPLASRVVEIDGYKLLDGGVADSIPIRKAQELGYERCVVVLTRPVDYVKEKNRALPLMRLALKQYPRLVDTMARRQDIYNETVRYLREEERAGRVFVLRPEAALPVRRTEHDPEKLRLAYDQGRAVAEKRMAALLDFLTDETERKETI